MAGPTGEPVKEAVAVYPNPASQEIEITVPDAQTLGTVLIHDLAGKEVMRHTLTGKGNKVAVQVLPLPDSTLTVSGSDSICQNSRAVYSLAGSTLSSYQWQVQGGQIISGQGTASVQVVWQQNGSIGVTETNVAGCQGKLISKPVKVHNLPEVQVNSPQSDLLFCEPDLQIKLYSITGHSPGNTYNWIVKGGMLQTGHGSPNVTINWQPGQQYGLKVVPISTFGCVGDTVFFSVDLR